MTIALSVLVARLMADVPSRNGAPSSSQYQRAVEDSVADYSQRKSLRRSSDLDVVAGTAAYTLPDDFLRLIELEGWPSTGSDDGVMITTTGIVPVAASYTETIEIEDGTLTITPTPTYTLTRRMLYAAGHVLVANDYPLMTESDAAVILLRAQALALRILANAAVQEAWKYAEGDESVDKTAMAKAMQEQAKILDDQYQADLKRAVGPLIRASPSTVR